MLNVHSRIQLKKQGLESTATSQLEVDLLLCCYLNILSLLWTVIYWRLLDPDKIQRLTYKLSICLLQQKIDDTTEYGNKGQV